MQTKYYIDSDMEEEIKEIFQKVMNSQMLHNILFAPQLFFPILKTIVK